MSYSAAHVPPMHAEELTLEELAERTGIEPRTLRSWVAEGLLAPPSRGGRGATYPASNVARALAVRALKEGHGLTLADIGRRFLLASDEQIRLWAAGAAPPAEGSAREYLRRIRQVEKPPADPRDMPDPLAPSAAFSRSGPPFETFPPHKTPALSADRGRIEELILLLRRLLAGPAPRRSRGEIWTRIAVTADLELAVRGDLLPSERLLFEQLADQLRALLTGRTKA
ncbi:MAG: helix-turn-helix domain-containing protein [Sphingomonadaceae bacterium]